MRKSLLGLLLLSGCATQGVDRADQNVILKEFYATAYSVKKVELSSDVKTGVVGGAAVGVIDELDGDHEDMIAGGLAGALVGGIFTSLFEGDNNAYEYHLYSEIQGNFSIIQKDEVSIETGCVKVVLASKATIFATSKENCKV